MNTTTTTIKAQQAEILHQCVNDFIDAHAKTGARFDFDTFVEGYQTKLEVLRPTATAARAALLTSKSADDRLQGVSVYNWLGYQAAEALALLKDKSARVREAVVSSLDADFIANHPAIMAMVKQMAQGDRSQMVRFAALDAC